MTRYPGGTEVPRGYYYCPGKWTLTSIATEGEVLPGDASLSYVELHWAAALLLAAVLGGFYVVLLPFLAIAKLARGIFQAAVSGASRGAKDLAATVAPAWRPGEAHLTGSAEPPAGEVSGGGAGEKALDDVAHEISRKRKEGNGSGD